MDIWSNEEERKFTVKNKEGKELNLKIVKPTQEQIHSADLIYKKKFSQALREGVITRAQAEYLLKKNGIIDEQLLIKRDEMIRSLHDLRNKLIDLDDRAEGLNVVKEIGKLNQEIESINAITQEIMHETAESHADNIKVQWLLCELTLKEDGNKYFANYQAFMDSVNDVVTVEALKHMILFLNNLKPNFEMEYQENKWMLEQKILNEDGTLNIKGLVDITTPVKEDKSDNRHHVEELVATIPDAEIKSGD